MNEQLRNAILGRWHKGQSIRGIARDLGISRRSVDRVIARHQQQRATGATELPAPRAVHGSLIDPYEAQLREYLARYPGMSAVRLLEELRRPGRSRRPRAPA